MVKKRYFRKVAFGIGPHQQLPDDPVIWAQSQLDDIPPLSWQGDVLPGKTLLDHYAHWVYTDRKVLRKRHKKDRKAYRAAKEELRHKTGERYFENLELCIRHDAAINSGAPVFERFWWFWCNHFAITDKDFMPQFTTGPYHREILRQNMCGTFEALTVAATTSWAMIHNLDNSESVGPNSKSGRYDRQKGRSVSLNENHARELLELHTVSPAAGYTQDDVISLAKIMTGWEHQHTKKRQECNPVKFNQDLHEPGTHHLFGKAYAQNGLSAKNKLIDVIKDLAAHPETAKFIAMKLCRHFVCDHPSPEIIQPVLDAWTKSNGDLPTVHKAVVAVAYEHADQFEKMQPPEIWLMQMVNMTGASWPPAPSQMHYDFRSKPRRIVRSPQQMLRELGHNPYRPTQPNGWPDTMIEWLSPELLIRRLALAKRVGDKMFRHGGWKPRHMIDSNFDSPDEVFAHIGVQDGSFDMVNPSVAIQLLFPSKWMVIS